MSMTVISGADVRRAGERNFRSSSWGGGHATALKRRRRATVPVATVGGHAASQTASERAPVRSADVILGGRAGCGK